MEFRRVLFRSDPRRHVVLEAEETRGANGRHPVPVKGFEAPARETLDGPSNRGEQPARVDGVVADGAGRVRGWSVYLHKTPAILDQARGPGARAQGGFKIRA